MATPHPIRRSVTGRALAGAVALALVPAAAACGSGAGGVEAEGAWARPSPMMADAVAAYMVLSADEEVTIVSVSAPAEIAARAELHETVAVHDEMTDDEMTDGEMTDGEMTDEMTDDAMTDDAMTDEEMTDGEMSEMAMTMQAVSSIAIPAGGEVALEPGGYHVMLLDLPEPLAEGDTFDLTFTQDDGEEFSVSVEVRTEAP